MKKILLFILFVSFAFSQASTDYKTERKIFNNIYDEDGFINTGLTDGTNNVLVNSEGQLHVVLMGKVDDDNSTSTLLGIDAVFTGDSTNILNYGYIFVTVFSDVASATDGLSVEQSSDGTNWDNTDEFTLLAGTGKTYSFQPAAKYFRIVYTNGGTEQAAFRLQTILKKTSSLASSHRLSNNLSQEDDGSLVIAVIKGDNPQGDFVNFQATANGNFKTSMEEYDEAFTSDPLPVRDPVLHIAQGLITGISHVNKFGRAVAGVQTVLTDIWDRADASVTDSIWIAPTQARIHTITSSSDADSVTATGARTIRIYGLTSWDSEEVSEVISLDGVTGPNTVNAYVIIHRMEVLTKGSVNVNVGDIIATAAVDGTITAEINALEGQTQMAIYGVPSTQTAYMTSYYGAFNKAGGATVFVDMYLVVNPEPDNELLHFLIKSTIGLQSTGSSYVRHAFNPYFAISGPAIIKMQGTGSANDLDTSAGFDLIIIDN